jgi:DNA mismatch endonuclease (patch repair protein)
MSRPGIFRDRAMADHTDKETRSAIMSKVRSKDTKPEMEVRRALHRAGFRFRLHRSDLPGTPDLVFPRYGLALFVHGCFWHRHGCKRTSMPATNREFWAEKFRRTLERDRKALKELKESGWETAVIWECQLETGINRLLETLTESAKRFG